MARSRRALAQRRRPGERAGSEREAGALLAASASRGRRSDRAAAGAAAACLRARSKRGTQCRGKSHDAGCPTAQRRSRRVRVRDLTSPRRPLRRGTAPGACQSGRGPADLPTRRAMSSHPPPPRPARAAAPLPSEEVAAAVRFGGSEAPGCGRCCLRRLLARFFSASESNGRGCRSEPNGASYWRPPSPIQASKGAGSTRRRRPFRRDHARDRTEQLRQSPFQWWSLERLLYAPGSNHGAC